MTPMQKRTKFKRPVAGYNIRVTVPVDMMDACGVKVGDLIDQVQKASKLMFKSTKTATPTSHPVLKAPAKTRQFKVEIDGFFKPSLPDEGQIVWIWKEPHQRGWRGEILL